MKIKKYKDYACLNASLGSMFLCIGAVLSFPANLISHATAGVWYLASGINYYLARKFCEIG